MERHDLDAVSLLSGLVFSAVGLAALVGALHPLWVAPRWIVPALLIVLGVGVLSAAGRRGRDGG